MTIALTGGRLIDGNGGNPVPDANIVIEEETITKVGPATNTPVPKDAQTIDVAGKTVMRGLIDGHIHIVGEYAPDPMDPFTRLPSYASITGCSGITQASGCRIHRLPCMNDADYAGIALKHAIEHGLFPGPRMLAAGFRRREGISEEAWTERGETSMARAYDRRG